MQVATVSRAQIADVRSALEHVHPVAPSDTFKRSLKQVFEFLNEVQAERGPLADVCQRWHQSRSIADCLPEAHERAHLNSALGERGQTVIANLEGMVHENERNRAVIAEIFDGALHNLRTEGPILVTIGALSVMGGMYYDKPWLTALAIIPTFILVVQGAFAFQSRLLLAKLHNSICDGVAKLDQAEAVMAEREHYEQLLGQTFEKFRQTVESYLTALEAEIAE